MADYAGIAEYLNKNRIHKRWQKALACMAAVVVFTTTYALILPAITASSDTYCGHKAHTHSDGECYKETKKLICTEVETEGHSHGESCYTEEVKLVCEVPETAGHHHSESCMSYENVLICGLEESQEEGQEHTHSDSCYKKVGSLICGQEEYEGHTHGDSCYQKEKELTCKLEEQQGHTHADGCYDVTREMVCDKQEHVHTDLCFSNPKADVESAQVWERSLHGVNLTGNWAEDVLAIADTQLGYHESKSNYILDANGKHLGYSRYGDWYGNSYGHWCAMFVSFCLHYAEVDSAYIPYEAGCQNWIQKLNSEKYELYYAVNDHNSYAVRTKGQKYTPQPGDLIFFNWDKQPDADHVGLVYELKYSKEGALKEIKTIEGNTSNQVAYRTYNPNDDNIMGFARLPQNPQWLAQMEAEKSEHAEETADIDTLDTEATDTEDSEIEGSEIEGADTEVSEMKETDPEESDPEMTDSEVLEADNTEAVGEEIPEIDELEGEAELETVLTAECAEATAEAVFTEGVLPENTVMTIALLLEEDDIAQSNELLAENAMERNLEIIKNYLFDISFYDENGNKLEPDGNVKVSISIRKDESEELISGEVTDLITWEVVHITEQGQAEVLTEEHQTSIIVSDTNMLQTVSFENNAFSEYSVQAVQAAPGVSLLADGEAGESYTNMSPESDWLSYLPVTLQAAAKGTYVHPSSHYQHYQASSHAVRLFGEETYYTPSLFTLVEKTSSSRENWEPNSIYYSPNANYDVVYCADYRHQPGTDAAYIYKTLITDSTVVQSAPEPAIANENKRRLCAVVANSYPYVSAESMIAAAGLGGTGCTESECLIAAQIVIWRITNPILQFDYGKASQNAKDHLSTGYSLPEQLNPIPNSRCNWTSNGVTNDTVAYYVNTLIDYLEDIGDAGAKNTEYIYQVHPDFTITAMEIESIAADPNGANSVTVSFQLDRNLTSSETVTAVLRDENGSVISEELKISSGSNAGEITFRNVTSLPEEIELYLESDYTSMGVYYYTYGNSNDTYQRMIGARPDIIKTTVSAKAPAMTSVSVRKTWVGGSDYPAINVTLYRNGEPIDTAELSGESQIPWYHVWTQLLPNDEAGNPYEYTVAETSEIPGFEKGEPALTDIPYVFNGKEFSAATNYEITNTSYEIYKTTISASKAWEGEGEHPGSVQIQLKQDGEVIDTTELSTANHWFKKWEELAKYKNDGTPHVYEVVESPVAGYISNIAVTSDKDYFITEDAVDPETGMVKYLKYVDSIVGSAVYITNTDYGVLTAKGGRLSWESFDDALTDPYASWKISSGNSNSYYYWQNNGSGQYLATSSSSLSLTSTRGTIAYNSNKQIYHTYISLLGRTHTVLFEGSFSSGKGNMGDYGVYLYPMVMDEKEGIIAPGKDPVQTESGDLHFNITNTKIIYYDFTLKKVDSTNKSKTLSGAAFDLYMQSDSAETVVPTLTGVIAEKIGSYTTGEDGTLTVTNLAAGITYYLYETSAPAGYTRNGATIAFSFDTNGNVTILEGSQIAETDGSIVTVVNTPGVILPNTGGIGTHMYTLAGLLLILIAFCLGYIKLQKGGLWIN